MKCTLASGLALVATIAATASIAGTKLSGGVPADEVVADRDRTFVEAQAVTSRGTAADVLKREYLKCDRAAIEGRIDGASVVRCSFLYEELRDRVFGGDFDALLAWWREAR